LFERFTDRARRVVVLAQEEARMLNHNYIGTEHILLGLIHEGEGVANEALTALGVSLEAVRGRVEEIIGQGKKPLSGHIPFTPRAKKVLELSLREALSLGNDYIGTEHILLGLIREGDGVACHVLTDLGVGHDRVRELVIERAGERGPEAEARPGGPGRFSVTLGPGALPAIEERLDRIERRLGIEPPTRPPELRRLDEKLAEVRRDKEAAIDAQNFEPAAALRDEEKRLLAERAAAEKASRASEASVTPLLEELAAARAEIARLLALLREHGVEPGDAAAS
jgi:ATP-dependent Clp protease ATP-binding subunit ClpA